MSTSELHTQPAAASSGALHNILIISDLHLGEDLRPSTSKTGYLRHLVVLERELEAFLDHYAGVRMGDRPWRLIVNGDMVDFLSVCLLPQGAEVIEGHEVDEEERVYGLGTRPNAARTKMRRVIDRHRGVFAALARFVGAGNELSIVAGNHDVEFHWPVVQETFKKGVADRWAAESLSARAGAPTPAEVEGAITFHPWFYFQENVVWVEHGHQYDDYCSFDYVLNPVAPAQSDLEATHRPSPKDEVVLNVGAAAIKYVGNHFSEEHSGQGDNWDAIGYLKWTLNKGWRGVLRIAAGYFAMVWRMLTLWRVLAKKPLDATLRLGHRERLRLLSSQCRLSEETLDALDALRRRPVATNLIALAGALMLDKVLIVAGALVMGIAVALALPWQLGLIGVACVFGLAVVAQIVLGRFRSSVDASAKMRQVPELIRRHVRAPFVVFGHSHNPVAVPLENGGMYFNTGTWVATEKPGVKNAFTHVLIQHGDEGVEASLCQWWAGQSRTYAPAVTPVPGAPATTAAKPAKPAVAPATPLAGTRRE